MLERYDVEEEDLVLPEHLVEEGEMFSGLEATQFHAESPSATEEPLPFWPALETGLVRTGEAASGRAASCLILLYTINLTPYSSSARRRPAPQGLRAPAQQGEGEEDGEGQDLQREVGKREETSPAEGNGQGQAG